MITSEHTLIATNRHQLDRSLWYSAGFLLTMLATSEETGGHFSLVEEMGARGLSANPPLHIHSREEEGFYIIEGELTFYVGDEIIHGRPGSFVVLPRGVPHSWVVESETVRLLNLCVPGGFEGFFQEMSEPAPALSLPPAPDGPPDVEKLVATAARYGVEVIGPPPA